MDEMESRIADLSKWLDALFLGMRIFLFLFLLMASIAGINSVLTIPKFQSILADALPGQPLPAITLLVIRCQSLLSVLAFLWPVLGIVALCLNRRIFLSLALSSAALAAVAIQTAVILTALQLPMTGIIISGMSNTH